MPLIPNSYTPDIIMLGIIAEGRRLKVDDLAIVCAFACAKVESSMVMYANAGDPDTLKYPYQKLSTDKNSAGIYQQRFPWWDDLTTDDGGGSMDRMSVAISTKLFLTSLLKQTGPTYKENPGIAIANTQRPREDLRWKYGARMDESWADFNRLKNTAFNPDSIKIGIADVTDENKPPFNEFWIKSPSNSPRGNTAIDMFLLHTQEGGGGNAAAESLGNFCAVAANQVSYHYGVSQASDGGVTVVDMVDTDYASWSVLSANSRSINGCFAGSRASWTRDQWLKQINAIEVMAYLAVQDAKKYGFSLNVVPRPYTDGKPGISDHYYVTKILKDGSHTDIGDNFPWDKFKEFVVKYSSDPTKTPDVPVVVVKPPVQNPSIDYQKEIWDQLRIEWDQLGGRTMADALGAIGEKLGIEGMYDIKKGKQL